MTDINTTMTVIIVTYNSGEFIRDCLDALHEQTLYDADQLQIIVVDNASSDETCLIIRRHYPRVTLIALMNNIGFGRACNVALGQSSSGLVAFVNPDCVLYPDWLHTMTTYMNEETDVAIAGSTLISGDETHVLHVGAAVQPNGLTHHIGAGQVDIGQRNQPLSCDYVTAATMICRRSALQAVGNFSDDFFLYYEEVDLCYRLRALGWKIHVVPSASAKHYEKHSMGYQGSIRYYVLYHRSRLLFISHHASQFPQFFVSEFRWLRTSIGKRQRLALALVYILSIHRLIFIGFANTLKGRE